MEARFIRLIALLNVVVLGLAATTRAEGGTFRILRVEEPTIADIYAAMNSGELTCRQLVQSYLNRIAAYDKKGPTLNAITVVNPQALALATELDAKYVQSWPTGPLHCIPVIVKDNYNTADL